MGTRNFAVTNTDELYVIKCEDHHDIKKYIDIALRKLDEFTGIEYIPSDIVPIEENRNYPAIPLGYIERSIYIEELLYPIELRIVIKIVSGYYTDAVLDYEVNCNLHEFSSNNIKNLVDELFDNPNDYISYEIEQNLIKSGYIYEDFDIEVNKIMESIGRDNTEKLLTKYLDELIEKIESIFNTCTTSTKMCIIATFSNGETMYKEVS